MTKHSLTEAQKIQNKRAAARRWRLANPDKARDATRRWCRANPDKVKAYAARRDRTLSRIKANLKWSYGISIEDYATAFAKQNGCCALCSKSPDINRRRLSVDHCHDTGKVRGLLCLRCNSAIAQLGDNERGLRKALAYVTQ